MKILPFVSAGEVILVDDGKKAEVMPVAMFRLRTGGAALRVGSTIFYFDEHGRFQGPEYSVSKFQGDLEELMAQVSSMQDNRGRAPAEPYFAPTMPNYVDEIAVWDERPSAVLDNVISLKDRKPN